MIVFYIMAVVAGVVAGGLTYGLSLFSAPLWAQLMIGGAAFPIYLACASVYLAFVGQLFKTLFKDDKDAKESK